MFCGFFFEEVSFFCWKCEIKNILGLDFYEKCVKLKVKTNIFIRKNLMKNKKAFYIGFKICTRRVIMTISKNFYLNS